MPGTVKPWYRMYCKLCMELLIFVPKIIAGAVHFCTVMSCKLCMELIIFVPKIIPGAVHFSTQTTVYYACYSKPWLYGGMHLVFRKREVKIRLLWAVVVVKWSACSPSTPTIRVRIPLRSTIFL